jgi:heme exporter protein A
VSALLALNNGACIRGDRLLFRGLSLALAPGEALWLRGPNGVGKSSLLRVAAGLLPLADGTLTRSAALALADERTALDPELPLARALGFWAPIDGADPQAVQAAMAVRRRSSDAASKPLPGSSSSHSCAPLAMVRASTARLRWPVER